MARQAAPKKIGKRTLATMNKGFYGEEPVYDRLLTSKELSEALTWYNYNMDEKTGNAQLVQFLEDQGRSDDAKAAKKGGDKFFTSSLGRLARIVNMGGKLPEFAIDNFENAFTECLIRFKEANQAAPKTVYKDTPKVNERNVELAEAIQQAIDKRAPRFSLIKFLTKENVNKKLGVKIA